jgi:hypothetical protein
MKSADIQLKPLYRVRFSYPEGWGVSFSPPDGNEGQHFFIAEGRAEGRISGTFRGTNHPSRRSDGTYLPNFQGIIQTDDGAEILFDYRGYGRAYPAGRRQIVVVATHVSEDEKYRWLNDCVAVGVGEVRTLEGGDAQLVIDWAEVLWSAIPE